MDKSLSMRFYEGKTAEKYSSIFKINFPQRKTLDHEYKLRSSELRKFPLRFSEIIPRSPDSTCDKNTAKAGEQSVMAI